MLYKTAVVLMFYSSLGIGMKSDNGKFMGVNLRAYRSLQSSFLREYCNNNQTQDCLFIRDHVQKSNNHEAKRRSIHVYGYKVNDLSSNSTDPIIIEPVIEKLKEKKQKYPNWNKSYWNTLPDQEKQAIVAATKNITKINERKCDLPEALNDIIDYLD